MKCLLLLLVSLQATVFAQDAITALRNDYGGPTALCRVRINGLHASSDLVGRPLEVHVVNGAIARGGFISVHSGRDVAIPAGQLVRITDISPVSTSKNDELRVTVAVDGYAIPIGFVLPKGSLATASEEQLQQLVGGVLESAQSAPPPSPSAPVTGAKTQQTAQQNLQAPQRTPLANESIDELNAILKHHNGDAILKPGGVRAAMITPENTPDNLIIEGVLQPRAQGMYHGMRDVALWPNTQVQFMELRAFSDEQHDYVRLVVRAPIGAFAPITWVLPKGQLASVSKKQVMQIIDPVIVFAAADEHTFGNEGQNANSSSLANPAMKASRPPDPGCEWVPFTSRKYGFELMRERCQNQPLSEALSFDVYRKPAGQSIEAAIQQQIIAKFKDPRVRGNCRVVQSTDEEEPGWHEYSIKAFGSYPYPKVSKEQEMEKQDAPNLCGGWDGGDVSNLIVYNPVVTKEMFFAFRGLSDPLKGQPDDIFSLKMLPENR